MSGADKIVGHKTFSNPDGSFRHEPLRQSEADAIMAQVKANDKRRKELMPDEDSAIRLLFDAYVRLKEFGWNDAIYCPKDGRVFDAIECGSTGIHPCTYQGEWPEGSWWIDDCPSRPVLYRSALTAKPGAEGPALAPGCGDGEQGGRK